MDFLKEEIARKKRQLEEKQLLGPTKKYFKRGELAKLEEEEYLKKHNKFTPKAKVEQVKKDVKKDSLDAGETSGEQHMLPRKEVIRRLRERGEPVRLYAETDYEAFQRLKKMEILEPEVNRGFRNELKAAMDQVDHEYLQEIMKSGDKDMSNSNDVKVKHVGVTMEQIQEEAKEFGKGNYSLDCDIILKYLKFLLQCWGEELNSRPPDVKRSMKGKLDSATQSQTVAYLKPLFRKLKNKQISEDILDSMIKIVKFCLDRNYIKANDTYLEMAIGNAPWPIGVTMVGIHARTGREKIFDKNVAHVLNDETQRKYIQGIKRLMTKCQKFFPTAPSRSVDYDKNT